MIKMTGPMDRRTILAKLASCGLTGNSANTFIAMLDPFHDGEIECQGYPDNISAPSVFILVTRQLEIPIAAAGDLNIQVHMTPCLNDGWQGVNNTFTVLNSNRDIAGSQPTHLRVGTVASNNTGIYSGCLIRKSATPNFSNDITLPDFRLTPLSSGTSNTSVDEESWLVENQYRVITSGLEIICTAAPMNAGGSITVYKMGSDVLEQGTLGVTYTTPAFCNYAAYQKPPLNTDTVRPWRDTKSWDVKKGAYMVGSMKSVDLPIRSLLHAVPVVYDKTTNGTAVGTNGSCPGVTSSVAQTTGDLLHGLAYGDFFPYGAFCTGMQIGGSLLIKCRWGIEIFPNNLSNSAYATLARPSPTYDPLFFKCLSEAMSETEIAVPANQNAAGDYFRKVVSALHKGSKMITKVEPFLAHTPLAPLARMNRDVLELSSLLKRSPGSRRQVYNKAINDKALVEPKKKPKPKKPKNKKL